MGKLRLRSERHPGHHTLRIRGRGLSRRRLVIVSFAVIFVPAAVFVVLQPETYKAEMRILVKRGRVKLMVTANRRRRSASAA